MAPADDPDIRRYLAELQEAVGRGEIDTEDFDALAEAALTRAERGEPVRPPTTGPAPPRSPRRRGARPTRNPRARRILTGFLIFWAAAFLLNVTVLAVLSVSAGAVYFWPLGIGFPGTLLLIVWLIVGFDRPET
ncbi:hypothetical protein B841_11390 [Corynebacterium maris DSM 45190]|uniref:SHOCT domain-containing protein n=1 Tax=Corynebacterium maris DSM 45190 TaxID=1224163 RepID=S5T538_9CORY|nr:hypothetical protein [Corynebacterium maris]AGS35750.1 hypothetical protein B841_11390 [Corynebacterium maris DSM 45190]